MEATISHLRVFAPLSRTREGGREVGRRERKGRGEKLNSSGRNAARLGTGPSQMPALSAVGRAGDKEDAGVVTSARALGRARLIYFHKQELLVYFIMVCI